MSAQTSSEARARMGREQAVARARRAAVQPMLLLSVEVSGQTVLAAVLGVSGQEYQLHIGRGGPMGEHRRECSCPDSRFNLPPTCKHAYLVLKAIGVPDDVLLTPEISEAQWAEFLRAWTLRRARDLGSASAAPVAGAGVAPEPRDWRGMNCPICVESMLADTVFCPTCRNATHRVCAQLWLRAQPAGACPCCRALPYVRLVCRP